MIHLNGNYDLDDEYDLENDIEFEKTSEPVKRRRRKKSSDEYYVKGAELIAEIKKYHESKRLDAEKKRCSI